MTTPQHILYEMEIKLRRVIETLEGTEESKGIFEMINAIDNEAFEYNIRLEKLEDKMDLIIKLLSK